MRNISEFKGSALLVGGGWSSDNQSNQPFIRNKNNFYTIDINPTIEPDAVIDFLM